MQTSNCRTAWEGHVHVNTQLQILAHTHRHTHTHKHKHTQTHTHTHTHTLALALCCSLHELLKGARQRPGAALVVLDAFYCLTKPLIWTSTAQPSGLCVCVVGVCLCVCGV